MTNRTSSVLVLLLAASSWGALAGGCRGESRVAGGGNSETHFLARCTEDCAGGLECVCGVCTRTCESAHDCRGMATGAECLPACSDEKADSICDVRCSTSSDCKAVGGALVCESGRCRSGGAGATGTGASGAGAGGGGTNDAGASGMNTSSGGASGAESSAGGRAATGGSGGAQQGGTGGGGPEGGGGASGGSGARSSGTGGAGGEGASAGDGASSGVVELKDFPRAMAEAICPGMDRCCTNHGWPVNADCIDQITTKYTDDLAGYAPYPSVAYDPALGAACIDAYRVAVDGCYDPAEEPQRTAACRGMFYGTIPDGGACSIMDECAAVPGTFVECTDGACVGGQPLPASEIAKEGDPCGSTCDNPLGGSCGGVYNPDPNPPTSVCLRSDGLFCSEKNYVCQPIAAVGEPCEGAGCMPNVSYCDTRCVAFTDTGPCGPDGPYCTLTSDCNPNTNMCTPRLANGQACVADADCASLRCYDGVCHDWAAVTQAFCAGTAAL